METRCTSPPPLPILALKEDLLCGPPDTFITKWVGNYLFYTTKDQECKVLLALQNTLADKTTVIGKEIDKLPLFLATSIINCTKVRAYQVRRSDPETHWAFYLESPHPKNIKLHHRW